MAGALQAGVGKAPWPEEGGSEAERWRKQSEEEHDYGSTSNPSLDLLITQATLS